ncbi:helix-turn-helix domain-containing protein [Rossellomorea sp. NS-SX7]|uniref:helix-turn-helix domain-containing protein n=1 Tax=Rossellomorea sp. NS-SX7 TaxID=3463856 RepID=UPI00405A3201
MDKEVLGKEIKKLRKLRNLTQKQLAEGICNQSEISRLEKGEVFPSIDILHLVANKLKVPTFYFYEVLIHDNISYKNNLTGKLMTLVQNKDYIEVYKLVENELKKTECHPEFKQFLLWQYYVSAYYLKKINSDTCLTELKLLLQQQTFGTNVIQDLFIKNSIANIYAEKRKFKESIRYYDSILNSEIDSLEYTAFRNKVLYNLSKVLFLDNQIELSLSTLDEAIEWLCRNSDMSLLGQVYFQKAECLEKLNYPYDEISECYKKALFFFKLLGLTYYEKIIIEKKQRYLN